MANNISKEAIEQFLNNEFSITVKDSVSSTNTVLKELARNGEKDKSVLIAKSQTAGRGRLGRSFYSPENSGIYMSILLRPESFIDCKYITPLAAVSVFKALEHFGAKDLGIKWVNDIFSKDKKICGILTEIGFKNNSHDVDFLIIGIGINVTTSDFPNDIKNIAGSVFSSDNDIDKNKIIAKILDNLLYFYEKLPQLEFLVEYKSKSILTEKTVTLVTPVSEEQVFVLGIDDDCCLIVKKADGTTAHISTGEVSIKL